MCLIIVNKLSELIVIQFKLINFVTLRSLHIFFQIKVLIHFNLK